MDTTKPPHEYTTLDALKSRLEDLRLQIHLGGMEAQQEFDELMIEVERLARKSARKTRTAARLLLQRVRELESRLIVRD
jgi:putative hemolysin